MENPFPRINLTLVNCQENDFVNEPVHDIEELLCLAFPKSYERKLRLVHCSDDNGTES